MWLFKKKRCLAHSNRQPNNHCSSRWSLTWYIFAYKLYVASCIILSKDTKTTLCPSQEPYSQIKRSVTDEYKTCKVLIVRCHVSLNKNKLFLNLQMWYSFNLIKYFCEYCKKRWYVNRNNKVKWNRSYSNKHV